MSPNPMVGAVLVKNGRIVARGYHARFGGPHAEVECLRSFRGDYRSATVYVNLEPCAHYGKTPPCADLIIRSGIRRVVVGMKDPNPLVAGRGIRKLRAAGVSVVTGVMESEARSLNRAFIINMRKKRPFVHVKIAQTLDGKIALRHHTSGYITGKESRTLVHRWRAEHDAVLVGAGTIRADNPRLNVRMATGRNPAVVVLDGALSVNPTARVFSSGSRQIFIVTTTTARQRRLRKYRQLESVGACLVSLKSADTTIQLSQILLELQHLGIGSLLVEGGNSVFSQFLRAGILDRLSVIVAPKLFADSGIPAVSGGEMRDRLSSSTSTCQRMGKDVLLDFTFE